MTEISKLLLSAGIHGNEKTGIYLIKKFQKNSNLISRSSFTTETLLINHQAIALNRRYCEIDLNRCFDLKDLNNNNGQLYEQLLAQKTYYKIKDSAIDFVI